MRLSTRMKGYTLAGRESSLRHRVTLAASVRAWIHSNSAESRSGLVKRSIQGARQHISAEHINRRLAERWFRWSNRNVDRANAHSGRPVASVASHVHYQTRDACWGEAALWLVPTYARRASDRRSESGASLD